jgi:hypothetical protein
VDREEVGRAGLFVHGSDCIIVFVDEDAALVHQLGLCRVIVGEVDAGESSFGSSNSRGIRHGWRFYAKLGIVGVWISERLESVEF